MAVCQKMGKAEKVDNSIMTLLSCDLLKQATSGQCSLAPYSAITALLITNNIPFDAVFSPATRRDAAGISLTVYITPVTTMVYNIALGSGGTVFTNNM